MSARHILFLIVFFIPLLCFHSSLRAQCGSCSHSVQLIQNGAFTSGNTGFTTQLTPGSGFFCPLCTESTYAVGSNAIFYHNGFSGTDHTQPPTGNFFIANGAGQAGVKVWCQHVDVEPFTQYTFSFWGRDVTNNSNPHPTAWLYASFNNVLAGDSLNCIGGWKQRIVQWNSGPLEEVDICIVNTQWQTGGNDFGLDDITLTGCHDYHVSQTADLPDDQTVCSGTVLPGIGMPQFAGYSYQWSSSLGHSLQGSNPSYAALNTSNEILTDTLVLSLDSANTGCVSTDTLILHIVPMPSLDLGQDHFLCEGETAMLDAGPGWDDVLWSDGSHDQSILVSESGTYSATVLYNSCSTTDDVEVHITPLPVMILPDEESLCEGETIMLSAGQPGVWSTGETGSSIIAGEAGWYIYTYEDNGCEVKDSTKVNVYPSPEIVINGPAFLCTGTTEVLESSFPGTWSTGQTGNSLEISSGGTYSITVTTEFCSSEAALFIEERALPQIQLVSDTSFCNHGFIELLAHVTGYDSLLWSTGDTSALLTVNADGTYLIQAFNSCGSAEAGVEVSSYPCNWDIYIPTAVTPDGNNLNEAWFPVGRNISSMEVNVYNRFGDRIFFASGPGEKWYPSAGQGDDTYTYLVKAITYDGREVRRTGFITVLR